MGEEKRYDEVPLAGVVCLLKSEWMEKKYTYPPEYYQSQNQQNNIQAAPASANGPSQPGGSNPVQGNPSSRLWRRVSRLFCLRN
ncbi:hypothetical protein CICLE_v10006343mg [Citrus x clementina]|uniref:Uncharacterized protein n=1 Tax=Citrus clementina TaxID=85681 RepID=V4SA39_CITCL|nr:hypothetical protein CICLE_v10006343mg [Citrus x clementina]GAY50395.1 hypothetical protein CUMW_126280 [Citrus unshiu]